MTVEVTELEFFVGLEDARTGTGDFSSFVRDPDPADRRALEPDRDLARDPFRLLLRPQDIASDQAGPGKLLVGVIGRDAEGRAVASGALAGPVAFVDGQVLQFTVELAPSEPGANDRCFALGNFAIAEPDDRDCDGFKVPDDCDDLDPLGRPGLREQCDGFDTNCDGELFAEHVPCFVSDGGDPEPLCFLGERECNDTDPANAGFGVCEPIEQREAGLCDMFEMCADAPDPFECATGTEGGVADFSCELFVNSDGPCLPARVALPQVPGTECTFSLSDASIDGPYDIALILRDGSRLREVTGDCAIGVDITNAGDGADAHTAHVVGQVSGVTALIRLDIESKMVELNACPEEGLVCGGLGPFEVIAN